jgi:hypothetical protein
MTHTAYALGLRHHNLHIPFGGVHSYPSRYSEVAYLSNGISAVSFSGWFYDLHGAAVCMHSTQDSPVNAHFLVANVHN